MVERRVSADERTTFLQLLSVRRRAAEAVRAHVWVFEHATDVGRFVEFTEAASPEDIAAVHDGTTPAPIWREVRVD
jgi:hypothetical protein